MFKYTMYKRDPQTGDRLIRNGNFVLIHDIDVVKQLLESNLKLIKKDWFLNFDEGILYLDNEAGLLGANEVSAAHEGQILATIENTTGVLTVEEFIFEIVNNELIVNSNVLSEFGGIILPIEVEEEIEIESEFIFEPLLTLAGDTIKTLDGQNIEVIARV